MSSRLTLISHAATSATRAAVFPKDEPIEASGQETARRLASSIGPFGAVRMAPELRAAQTATALNLSATAEASLRDIDLGRWAGLSFRHVEESEPESLMTWLSDPAAAPHGGETIIQLLYRVSSWLDGIDRKSQKLAVITHPAIVRAAVVLAMDAAPAAFWRIDVAPLARAELRSNGSRWTLRSLINE